MAYLTSFDKRQLRDVFGTFTTGVTIVTTRTADGKGYGVTANSFSSVSLDPPLILWSQALSSNSFKAFQESDTFAVNILADDQITLSNHFAKSGDDKFAGVEYIDGHQGVPVIADTAAHLECTKIATYPGGDHVVYLGRVERMGYSNRRALAFSGGRYMIPYAHDLGPVSLQLSATRSAHPDVLRRVQEAMPSIAKEVGNHSVCLAAWGNHGPTTLCWEPSGRPVSENFPVGLVLNISSSALGKAFAAFMPDEVTRTFVEEDLRLFRRAGEDPVAQREQFDEEMTSTRNHGVSRVVVAPAASRLHQIPTNAFAAPIYGRDGAMVFAMSIIAHVEQLDDAWDGPAPLALRAACARLSGIVGDLPG